MKEQKVLEYGQEFSRQPVLTTVNPPRAASAENQPFIRYGIHSVFK